MSAFIATTSSASTSTSKDIQDITYAAVTCTGARRRNDASLVGQLNAEWARLSTDPATAATVAEWAERDEALAGCASLPDIERAVTTGTRERTDAILLSLLRIGQAGQALAIRIVWQLMLGKAVRIAARHRGRDTQADLEHVAVTTLWTVIATYPVDRRPTKVAANIAMDTLRHTVIELAHQRHEAPADPQVLHAVDPQILHQTDDQPYQPADLELLNLLAWAIDGRTITPDDATLILDIYAPAPGDHGGRAAAVRHGLTWAAARQRASRAIRKVTHAIHADDPTAAAA